MTEFAVGDKVRVVYEGEVTHINGDVVVLASDVRLAVALARVEIVEKRKHKVGELFGSRDQLAQLAPGALVKNRAGELLMIQPDKLACARGGSLDYAWSAMGPYEIVYIP